MDEEEIGDEIDEESSSEEDLEEEVNAVDNKSCVESNYNFDDILSYHTSDSESDSELFHPFPRPLDVSGISKTFSPNKTSSNLLRQCLGSPKSPAMKTPQKNLSFRDKFRNSPRSSIVSNEVNEDEADRNEDSESFCDLLDSLPSSLQVSETRTPVKTKLLLSSSALNHSGVKSRKNETLADLNLSCVSCGNITDYSVDMGLKQDNFEVFGNTVFKVILLFTFCSVMTVCWEFILIVKENANFVKTWRVRWRQDGYRRGVSLKLQAMSSM